MNVVAKMLIDMAKFYGYELEKRQLELYVDVLSQFPAEGLLQCGKEYMQNPKNDRFPIPPHKILAKHLPADVSDEAQAREIAARIVGSVTKYGWANPKEAREFIGPVGWRVVEVQGGWSSICENLGVTIDPGVFQAQLREQLQARLQYGESAVDAAVKKEIASVKKTEGLIPMKDILQVIPGKKEEE